MNTYSKLSDETKAELKNCRTEEELKNVLAREGIELDAGMLEAISGGQCSPIFKEEETNRRRSIRGRGNCPPYRVF